MTEPYVATVLILVSGFVGLIFALIYTRDTAKISISPDVNDNEPSRKLLVSDSSDVEIENQKTVRKKVYEISQSITEGARSFLFREYTYMGVFVVVFGLIVLIVLGARTKNWYRGIFTATAFVLGCLTSIISGYIGMEIAVFANSRTALSAQTNIGAGFVVAFKAGAVMGFALVSLGVLMLFVIINLFNLHFSEAYKNTPAGIQDTRDMYESIAGYGLGGSSIALFGRVGGGIYTKAADVGADLVGKVEENIPEDDPRNPAVIADNVGDNVGDIAGMGADLFGSFAEASCAAMVVSAQSPELHVDWVAMVFPLTIIAAGTLVSLVTSFFATHIMVVQKDADIEPSLKRQILISTVLMTPVLFVLSYYLLPANFHIADKSVKNWYIFFCVSCGLWSGLVIGYITEYYTSKTYTPVQEVSNACRTGAATNIIYGLALGYKSVIVPVFCLAITIYVSYSLAGMYGIAVAALGILSTMAIGLTIDAYGPISDNAGGIAEMSGMGPAIRERTDALDAAGNTTAAIGKGFAIGSAALVSLALFGAFVTTVNLGSVDILQPFEFAGLLVGAMLPYWFSAMTMKSVGKAALAMVQEVRRQFREIPGIRDGSGRPDYKKCVSISTDASLREMLLPGALVMLTPLFVGFLFGIHALAGVLAGALVSGVQMAISCSNTGGAWDNAKKFIEGGGLGPDKGKGSAEHKAAVIGDTVGDPLKDTSGPALNILIKLSAIISLVFASSFPEKGLIEQIFN